MTAPGYRICTRCIMDTSDAEITFDEHGWCNHCRLYEDETSREVLGEEEGARTLEALVSQAKRDGRGKPYDCIVGLSGGVDSSFLALKACQLGLRPLAIHLDNSWDSETSVANVERIVKRLGLDLITHVVDWQEFRDIQRAYFLASVIDIEVITDHAITAMAQDVARERGIPWILSGANHVTESVMPTTWIHRKSDLRNLKAIHRRYGELPLRTLPTASMLRIRFNQHVRGIRSMPVLNYLPYDREATMLELQRELGWQYYGGKHFESLFTRFYQAHILPTKFGVDKRRAHFSTMICSGQMTREEAIAKLEEPVYPPRDLAHDQEYVLKKLGFTAAEWERIMDTPPRSHLDFPSDSTYIVPMLRANRVLKRLRGRL